LPLAIYFHLQRVAVDERRGKEDLTGDIAGIEQREDVGMLEFSNDLDLALEAFSADGGGDFGAEDLHSDERVALGIVREEYVRGAPAAYLPTEHVSRW
jgi:hypothetical protein